MEIDEEEEEMEEEKDHIQDFICAIHQAIHYWNRQKCSPKEKLEGLAHSILCMLDGVSVQFGGSIENLLEPTVMLHDNFYLEKNDSST